MYLFPIYFTLISFLVNILFGKWVGTKGSCMVTTLFVFLSLLSSFFIFYEVVMNECFCLIEITPWFSFDLLSVTWSFYFDTLTSFMLLVVLFVSFCAHLYSIEYMNGDPHQIRFMSYLSLFTFFMLILITASNFIQLFVGWEGVGICSYLLINFWYTRLKANKAAIMAVVVNKLGDICLMIAFGYVYYLYKSFDFQVLYSYIETSSLLQKNLFFYEYLTEFSNINYMICFLFILGAVGKSAQVGLHMWLPEAMEGPTPVSSLIHAATMVTAGIFLVLRCSFLFEGTPEVLMWIVFFGSVTAFFASSIGVFQNDLKKIIAYSTCSQLGYMFLSCGLSGYTYSFFHLFNHAFFKALLFLTAGYIIHSLSNEQDIRKMGGLVKIFPFSYIMITIASLSLMGLPFLSGFYSKEKIIDLYFNRYAIDLISTANLNLYLFFQILSIIGIIFTVTYSVKLLVVVFFGNYNGFLSYISTTKLATSSFFLKKNHTFLSINNIHYGSYLMMIPLLLLLVLSVFSGYFFKDTIIGNNNSLWFNSVSIPVMNDFMITNKLFFLFDYEFNDYMRSVTFYWVLYFTCLNIYFFTLKNQLYLFFNIVSINYTNYLHKFLVEKYIIINKLFVDSLSYLTFYVAYSITFLLFDKGVIERFTSYGMFSHIKQLSISLHRIENKYITNHLFYFFIGYLLILSFLIY